MSEVSPVSRSPLAIRFAGEADAAALLDMVRELAEFERLAHQVVATVGSLRAGLGQSPAAFRALLAFWNENHAGYAVFFYNYSTFAGRQGVYLEDLYVRPAYRRNGIGAALLREVARHAVDRGCGRVEWSVLGWNESAMRFYRSVGAQPMSEWNLCRLEGTSLTGFAEAGGTPQGGAQRSGPGWNQAIAP